MLGRNAPTTWPRAQAQASRRLLQHLKGNGDQADLPEEASSRTSRPSSSPSERRRRRGGDHPHAQLHRARMHHACGEHHACHGMQSSCSKHVMACKLMLKTASSKHLGGVRSYGPTCIHELCTIPVICHGALAHKAFVHTRTRTHAHSHVHHIKLQACSNMVPTACSTI